MEWGVWFCPWSTHVGLAGHGEGGATGEAYGGGAGGQSAGRSCDSHTRGGGRRGALGAASATAGTGTAAQAVHLVLTRATTAATGTGTNTSTTTTAATGTNTNTTTAAAAGPATGTGVLLELLKARGGSEEGAAVARGARQHLHLAGEGLQLAAELAVLLLQLCDGASQRPAHVQGLLQTPLHAQLEGAHVHVDLSHGVPERALVAGQRRTHRLPVAHADTLAHRGQRSGVHCHAPADVPLHAFGFTSRPSRPCQPLDAAASSQLLLLSPQLF